MRTDHDGIYAIGDVTYGPWLDHKASVEGIICVEKIAGQEVKPLQRDKIASCIYYTPQVASIGLSAETAVTKGYKIKVGVFPFKANGRALASGYKEGFIKTVFEDIVDDFLSFLSFISDSTLVIHNAVFDMRFINNELFLSGRATLSPDRALDTLPMVKKAFPGAKGTLDALCKRFIIDIHHRVFHGALKDAELLMLVYLEMSGMAQTSLGLSVQEDDVIDNNANHRYRKHKFRTILPSRQEREAHDILLCSIIKPLWQI